ncbi:gliding motility-associated C-terminal domain-containing protein [Flavobacteriaceae bacterium F89]|uniref:Gliding motility-associated C-terminal domain-containing protein n=1 Tax=Cerina litoralis TaxID=2874477 RepID=A0AAE3F078_9FLAO|nr:gliding motility-associated C-terminal domain-containing protein [Cerina litoralis]MCG2462876.1 gliding motility-associated C-terminal domain-containing protein [Cerina litoralis]
MKKHLSIPLLLLGLLSQAQTGLYNAGNLQVHEGGQMGIHTNLINDGAFDQNTGLVGFYGSSAITISGAFMSVFYDTEVANDRGVTLRTSVSVVNNANFVVGNVITPRDQSATYFNFLKDAFDVGASDASYVEGYVAVTEQKNFTFPVGDDGQLRQLILNSTAVNPIAKCAYFFDNPSHPIPFPENFNTHTKVRDIGSVSETEFWRLEGSATATVTLSWNERSNLAALTDDVKSIIVVGWSKTGKQWVQLGRAAMGGDLSQGFVTSDNFVPDRYEAITFGTMDTPDELLTLDNYLVTPNGDGINDVLVIPQMTQSPNNSIRIYDRNGLKVFEMANYTDQFGGIANTGDLVINRSAGLPAGVYFYLVSLDDLGLKFQGFLYLER